MLPPGFRANVSTCSITIKPFQLTHIARVYALTWTQAPSCRVWSRLTSTWLYAISLSAAWLAKPGHLQRCTMQSFRMQTNLPSTHTDVLSACSFGSASTPSGGAALCYRELIFSVYSRVNRYYLLACTGKFCFCNSFFASAVSLFATQ